MSPFPPSFSPRPSLFSENSRLLTATVRCSLSRPLCFHVLVSCPSRTIDLHVLCFQIVTDCFSRKSFPLIIICVARGCGGMSFLPNSLCKRLSLSTPLFTYSCGLFVVGRKPNSFAIKQVQTLSAKYPGYRYPGRGTPGGEPACSETGVPFFAASFYIRNTHTSCAAGSKTRNASVTVGMGTPTNNSSRGSYRPISAIGTRTFSLLRLGWIRHGTQIRSFKAIV